MSGKDLTSEGRLWSQLWLWLREDRLKLLLLSFVILLNVVVSVAGPLFLKVALDVLKTGEQSGTAYFYTGLFALMLLLSFFTDMSLLYLVALLNSGFTHRLRVDVFTKVMENKISFFDNSIVGKLVSRIVNDSNELTSSAQTITNGFSQLFVFAGVLITMFVIDVPLTLATVFAVPLLFIVVIAMRKFQRRISLRWRERIGNVNANFGEIMASISVSKSFGREEENLRRFHEINELTYEASKIRGMAIFALGPMQDLIRNVGVIVLLFVASRMDNISISLIYLFVLLQGYLYTPVTQIARSYNSFQSSFAALERLVLIMADDVSREDQGEGYIPERIVGEVEFRDLTFSYTGDTNVLEDISLKINGGSTVAFVGHTGAGKSTLVSLIMKFYTGYSGQILIDGVPIERYDLKHLRSKIAYVAQDVFLFSGTILDNLRMANKDATMEDIDRALDAVQAREFLETLPQGLSTVIDEEGSNLSQGQKQMLSLARALIADPSILILDEFTSSLDLYTESKIQEALATLIKGRTAIVIAHRLTTILHSNKIIVMDHGKIIEEGTHHELMEKGGKYAELFNKYFSFQLSDLRLKSLSD